MTTRECLHCETSFLPSNGNQKYCSKSCQNKAAHGRKDKQRVRELQVLNVINNPEKRMLRTAKTRAKQKGWDFNLELSDIQIPDVCPLLGVSLDRCTPNAASLDRIDASKGYIKGNVMVISRRANSAKNDLTLDELKTLVYNLEKIMDERE